MELRTVTTEEVLRIHETLVEDFALTGDPIFPPGVRSLALLDSAVGRQFTGSTETLKYPNPVENAATLFFGLVCDHPFHNGNKRTALVALLVHLDKNKLALQDTDKNDLYKLVMGVATHSVGVPQDKRRKRPAVQYRGADAEVAQIAAWISKRSVRVVRGEKQITYRELKRILSGFGFSLEDPEKNSIDIIKIETKTRGLIRRRQVETKKRIFNIGYPGDTRFVSLKVLKQVRRVCRLMEEDGVDTEAFYSEAAVVDSFVNKYWTLLRRLGRK
jgi:death-on-curing family protein